MAKRPDDRPATAGDLGAALQQVQAELGLPVTALPVATVTAAPDAPATAITTAPKWPGPAAESVGHDDDHGHTVTVARGAAPAAPAPVAPPSETSNRRILLGTAAGVVCLLLVAGALLVFGGGDDGGDDPDSTAPATTQLLSFAPPAPQGVTVVSGTDPSQVLVTWQPVEGEGMHYQVRPQTGQAAPQNTTELQLAFDVTAGDRPCYTVVAISADGRISDPSPLACL